MNTLTSILVALILLVTLTLALNYSIEKTEISDCLKWKEQARVYPDFYLTNDQFKQCNRNHIYFQSDVK